MLLRHNTQRAYHIRRLLKSSVNKPSGIRSYLPEVYLDHICCSTDLDLKVNFTQCVVEQTLSGTHALQKQPKCAGIQMPAEPATRQEDVQHLQEDNSKAPRALLRTASAFVVTGHMQRTCIPEHALAPICQSGHQFPAQVVLDIQMHPSIAIPDQTTSPHHVKDIYQCTKRLFNAKEGRYLIINSPGRCCL